MNHCAMQQNAFAACEEMRGGSSSVVVDRRSPVFCPKPRRLDPLSAAAAAADPVRPLRWHASHQADLSDFKAGSELLDLFLTKGGEQVASSPPFFCGSPPSRAANPVVQDARFGEDRPPAPIATLPVQSGSPMSPRKGCVRAKFGLMPAAVRVEGFDCLNRDRRSHSITAVA
ncbi:uncharacterized protein LOC103712909 isoform X1 [Phoenix dactylifera]|uniref:Uncharacterized protein LOC103712909 isoform X1 n=1 Tax=Phoenix dactylifera TaxID=42345 RepID=A0A8B7CEX8_PHODC|nr:uncharacterized protein LOC103712909 isoform X1 [Phoenix dactylifera]